MKDSLSKIWEEIREIESAIASLRREGVQEGTVQEIRVSGKLHGYRLAWYDPKTRNAKFGSRLHPDSVGEMRKRCDRFQQVKEKTKRLNELKKALEALEKAMAA